MLRRLLLATLVAAAAPAAAQSLVREHSDVRFTFRQMGVPVEGRFERFDAQVTFDPKQPDAGRVTIAIDIGSASFGARDTEVEASKAAWFDAARFPRASFESTSVRATGPGRYDVAGRLTIKGRARDVVVPVTLTPGVPHATATGSFALRRLDYAIGDGEWADTSLVRNEVQVQFRLALAGLPAP